MSSSQFINPPTIVKSNMFDLSHDHKTTLDMGNLVPSLVMEILPGDKIQIRPEAMLRFMPMIAPVMHRIHVTQHFFFVPNRILWSNWEKWLVREHEAEPPYLNNTVSESTVTVGDILNYMGIPLGLGQTRFNQLKINAMPLAAYNLIFDEYYRDQNIQDERFIPLVDGPNTYNPVTQSQVLQRAWNHDYFTSCLPWPQKGDAVTIPLSDSGRLNVELNTDGMVNPEAYFYRADTNDPITGTTLIFTNSGRVEGNDGVEGDLPVLYDPTGTLSVDVSESSTLESLRRAMALQNFLERNARGGTRYIEHIIAHFGVYSDDARFQRPEYMGGMKQNVVISEVLSTASTDEVVGQMAGHGIAYATSGNIRFSAKEHGFVIGILNVQPVTSYDQGVHKMWTRHDTYDYAYPEFAHLGEQAVLKQEIYAQASDYNEEFGYIPRYSEYRMLMNRTSAEMSNTLDFWHLGRQFDTTPALNPQFIAANVSERIFAVETEDDHDSIVAHIYFDIKKISKLPKYGVPKFM